MMIRWRLQSPRITGIAFLLLLTAFINTTAAQKTLSGLWVGDIQNDSSTIRKEDGFEIALTEYRGKVYGYSRSSFIVNDTLYYILKRVKGTIDGDRCEVKDDEIVSYNFRGRIDKGVKVTTVFIRNPNDSIWNMSGDWKTNKTKKYYSVSGKVELREEKDLNKSKLISHLEELKLANELPFYADAHAPPPPPVKALPEKGVDIKPTKDTTKRIPPKKDPRPIAPPPVQPTKEPIKVEPVTPDKRLEGTVQTVLFVNDSLVIALYDNGEIDGDTVSVYLDQQPLMMKQGLKASAIKRTIYIPSSVTETKLVLFADNLGKYPPNTGLLVIYDGDQKYQLRFSADLTKNATIVLKRKSASQ